MPSDVEPANLSPTFLKVIDQFIKTLLADDEIEDVAIRRLENLLKQEAVPKPDEINETLFGPPNDGAS